MAQSKFEAMKRRLAGRPGVTDPAALAASIGRKKYGNQAMARAAKEHESAAEAKREMKRGGK